MERHNDPGRFTPLSGYEWTSNSGGGDSLHRNVIFRGNKAEADQATPLTTFDSENPDFIPSSSSFYYARVIAIPAPRRTAYDARRYGIKMADEVRGTPQYRAYTAPIWHTP